MKTVAELARAINAELGPVCGMRIVVGPQTLLHLLWGMETKWGELEGEFAPGWQYPENTRVTEATEACVWKHYRQHVAERVLGL